MPRWISASAGKATDAGADARSAVEAGSGGDLGRDPTRADATMARVPDADPDAGAPAPAPGDATPAPDLDAAPDPTPDMAPAPPTEPPTQPPPLPAIRPNGFHTVVIADTTRWDSIRALADADLGPILVSDNKPADLPYERWTRAHLGLPRGHGRGARGAGGGRAGQPRRCADQGRRGRVA
jgi:hypothetical protein